METLFNAIEKTFNIMLTLLKFTGITVQLTLSGILIGIILGLILAIGRLSKNTVFQKLAWLYIWVFRGTPLLMQLFFIYYALPLYSKFLQFPSIVAGIIALGLNSGAYLAEIIRAAILSIDKGQMEASKALGMTYGQAMRRIIIPQSYRRLIPPVGNEAIMLLKDSALVSSIALTELLRKTNQIMNNTGDPSIFLYSASIYLFLTTILTIVFQKLEAKYSIYE
jgi:polar amino acid transport system permease protein